MAWSDHAARMDDKVDLMLGDDIELAVDGVTFIPVKGFIIRPTESVDGIIGLDGPLGSRYRAKLNNALFLGEGPSNATRLRSTKLPAGTWKAGGDDPDEQGRYVIFDLQKA